MDHLKVISAIKNCRTEALGGHVEVCSEGCGYQTIAYNSCRNRHCPKCQGSKARDWVQAREDDLLPVTYFHVVFTLPASKLLPVILPNKKTFYNVMFKCASETLIEVGLDPKWLGAKTGAICVLHTWSQKLVFHPHIHCIVPAGGLSAAGDQWIATKKPDFFVHFDVLADLFRHKLLANLKKLNKKGRLMFLDQDHHLDHPRSFNHFCEPLYQGHWIAYAKPAFNGPKSVVAYLGQYIHKIAISNWRLIKLENDRVFFSYRDRSDGNTKKETSLHAFDFIKMFLQHVLPYRFTKIRAYGFLANRSKKKVLAQIRMLLPKRIVLSVINKESKPCPNCQKGVLIKSRLVAPVRQTIRPP